MTRSPMGRPGPWWARVAAFAHRRLWLTRAVTLGVRAIVLDGQGRVLLLRHTYTPGWHLPGGGVDRGETARDAVIRELREEAGLVCEGEPVLLGLYWNRRLRRDHVACFVLRDAVAGPLERDDWEIAEAGFFARDALPEGTTPATRARLREALDGAPVAATW